MTLGHQIHGSGEECVIIVHDWFCDSSSYDLVKNYLDARSFTYVFCDLRGYGSSKDQQAKYTVEEASQDILSLADSLRWKRFHLVGHSMSGMIAQHVAWKGGDRIKSVTAITPVPACGSPAPTEVMAFLEEAARSSDVNAREIVGMMTGGRRDADFVDAKVKKWRETSTADARIGYLHMFTGTDIASKVKGLEVPFLVVAGAHDVEGHQEPLMRETFGKLFPNVRIEVFNDSGHYPMQEEPVLLASTLDSFLREQR